jgi:hypothetical protein
MAVKFWVLDSGPGYGHLLVVESCGKWAWLMTRSGVPVEPGLVDRSFAKLRAWGIKDPQLGIARPKNDGCDSQKFWGSQKNLVQFRYDRPTFVEGIRGEIGGF